MLVEEPDDVGRRWFGAPRKKSVAKISDDGQVKIVVDTVAEIRASPDLGCPSDMNNESFAHLIDTGHDVLAHRSDSLHSGKVFEHVHADHAHYRSIRKASGMIAARHIGTPFEVLVYYVIDHVVADEWIIASNSDDYVNIEVPGRIGEPRQHVVFASTVHTDRQRLAQIDDRRIPVSSGGRNVDLLNGPGEVRTADHVSQHRLAGDRHQRFTGQPGRPHASLDHSRYASLGPLPRHHSCQSPIGCPWPIEANQPRASRSRSIHL